MLTREQAFKIAEASMPGAVDLERIRELQQGWYFSIRPQEEPNGPGQTSRPPVPRDVPIGGYCGLIVNKQTGEVHRVLGKCGVDRDLELYDKGYQFDAYDLVVLEVKSWNDSLDVLVDLRVSVTEPEYEHGTVWRVPRALTRAELRRRLSHLPCVFETAHLYSQLERLEEARQREYFRFEALEHRGA
jgi:hypothetical protein